MESNLKARADFRLKGLSRPHSATLELLQSDKETFWATTNMPQDRFDALFNWAKSDDNFWSNGWIAQVEHEGLNKSGEPINPVVISVREWDLPYKPI